MKLVLLFLLLAATTPARADDTRWRFDNMLGFRSGSFRVNNIDMGEFQGALGLGFRKGRWATFGEYSFAELQISEETQQRGIVGPSSGVVHRFGPNVRYSYMRFGSDHMSSDVFAELGVGLQHIRWDRGGHWTRPDVSLGLGTTTMFSGARKHWGVTIAMRLAFSRRSDVPEDAPIACGGPCDMATKPTGIDRSFMIDSAFHFGT